MNRKDTSCTPPLAVILYLVLVVGCQRSGGVAGPIANAGVDSSANKGAVVRLDGSSSLTGPDCAFRWIQLLGEPVSIEAAASRQAWFAAPSVLGSIEFELTVTEESSSSSDTVRVLVEGTEPESVAQKVQLHLHGHSNHNGATNPASMQWHSAWARETGTADVLWWSDHASSFDQRVPMLVDLAHGTIDPLTMVVEGLQERPLDPAKSFTCLQPEVTGGTPAALLDQSGLSFSLATLAGDDWQTFSYTSRSAQPAEQGLQKARDLRFNRPVSSEAVLEFAGDFGPSTLATRYEIVVFLAWHRGSESHQHRLVYRFVDLADWAPPQAVAEDEVLVSVPVGEPGMVHRLALLDAGLELLDGDDNTVSDVVFRISARAGSTATAMLRTLDLLSLRPGVEEQLASMERFAERYQERYGVVGHVGFEQHHPRELHMNALLPSATVASDFIANPGSDDDTRAWVQQVHDFGGLVSWNHPFGTSSWSELAPEGERLQRVRDMAQYLLDTRAFGADLLEIGYLNRGGMDLHDHLLLWDILTVNQLFMTGIGVSDSHGGVWATWQGPSSFTTWVMSSSTKRGELIERLKDGKAYFGNPFRWDGRFSLHVRDAHTGDVARIESDEALLSFELEPWDPALRVFLVQGLVRPGLDVDYLHARTELLDRTPVALDTRASSFVRLEAYSVPSDLSNRWAMVLITNPVVLLRN